MQQQVLTASRPELIEPFTGLAPRTFRRLVAQVERRGSRQVATGSTAGSGRCR